MQEFKERVTKIALLWVCSAPVNDIAQLIYKEDHSLRQIVIRSLLEAADDNMKGVLEAYKSVSSSNSESMVCKHLEQEYLEKKKIIKDLKTALLPLLMVEEKKQ